MVGTWKRMVPSTSLDTPCYLAETQSAFIAVLPQTSGVLSIRFLPLCQHFAKMDSIPANPSFILKIQSVASSVFGALFSRRHLAPTRQLEGTRQTTTSSSSPSAPQFRRFETPVNHQTHHYPSSSSEDNNLSKPASSLFRQLLICSAMETPYSFADNGPIPQGDPCSQLQSANVSKPIAPHRRAKRSQRERAARAVQQPDPSQEQSVHPVISTNDLSQQFKPRHEDGSVVKMDTMPSLAQRADQALLEYLDKRRITSHFLNEIDDFLTSYPELLKACPMWCYQLATLPPLDAYMFFIRGYLRPARYVDGVSIFLPWTHRLLIHTNRLSHHSISCRFLIAQSIWNIQFSMLNSSSSLLILVYATRF